MEDENLIKIKNAIRSLFPDCRIILFGSRGRGDNDPRSDYDILVVIKQDASNKQKVYFAGELSNVLGKLGIPSDVIVRTQKDVQYYKDKIGSITREAIKEGIDL